MPAWSVRTILLTTAVLLGGLAVAVWLTSGFRFTFGPIRFSATNPSRVLLQAAVVWLIAELVGRRGSRLILLAIAAVLVTAIVDSTPRRVGDGAEYVAMAMSMSRGGAPALSVDERLSLTAELRALPGFEESMLDEPLVGWDGRQDFYHFWLYSLTAAPFAAAARIVGAHVNHAFTAINVLLFGALVWWLVRNDRPEAAALLAAGPLLWWMDKAHTEVFVFVALAFAALLIDRWPAAALIAASLAAGQNPAAGVVLAVCLISIAVRRRKGDVPVLAILMALALAAAAPMYYRWHLGVWSPLSSTIGRDVPGLRALLTPVLDPNLGLLAYAPVLAGLACLGARQSRRTLIVIASAGFPLLVVFAQSGNVNHGGTPGVSRYALWLLALAAPLIAEGCEWLRTRHHALWRVAAVVSVAFSVFIFRPAWPDRAGDSPNWLATALWNRWPALDNPLPEVFAERIYGSGSSVPVPVPVGTRNCEKVLTRGDGQDTWWPVPCEARPAPAMCVAAGAMCYVNGGAYTRAPPQPTFVFDAGTQHAWTWRNARRLDPVLGKLGSGVRFVRLADLGGRVEDVRDLEHLYIVEGSAGVAAWAQAAPTPAAGAVRIAVDVPSTFEMFDANTLGRIGEPRALAPGFTVLPVPADVMVILLVSDAR